MNIEHRSEMNHLVCLSYSFIYVAFCSKFDFLSSNLFILWRLKNFTYKVVSHTTKRSIFVSAFWDKFFCDIRKNINQSIFNVRRHICHLEAHLCILYLLYPRCLADSFFNRSINFVWDVSKLRVSNRRSMQFSG